MPQVSANDLRNGMKIEIDKNPYNIVKSEFVKPGKGQAFTRVRIKNLINNKVLDKTFKSNEKILLADVQERIMRMLYKDNDGVVFMDDKTFDQITIANDVIADKIVWFKDDLLYDLVFYNGQVIDITPPNFMELVITQTQPGERGNTASGRVLKPAITETGAEVQVPIFIEEGEKIKIDTRTGEYVSRT